METRKKILLADDEPDVLKIVRFRLAKGGYEVVTAVDGREALDLIRQCKPDLVVTDYLMPHMDGLEVCRAIRQDAALQSVPIIVLTASLGVINEDAVLKAGATAQMVKPFDPDELLKKIDELIREASGSSGASQ